MRTSRALLLLACCTFLAACDASDPGPPPVQPRALTQAEAQVVAADNAFTFRLFEQVTAAEPGTNVFLSPFSASMALGMTLNGARGETREAMIEALQKNGMAVPEINAAYRGLLDLVPHLDRSVEIAIANSVWSREGFPVEPEFTATLRTYFDAEARALDFSDPGAAETINRWVRGETRGRIDELIEPPISSDVVMYLINALYFKAAWQHPFDPRDTRDDAFHLADGTTAPVRMMNRTGTYALYHAPRFAALDLPYGDSLYTMTVLLPHAGESVDSLIAGLDDDTWAEVVAGLRPQRVMVQLPRLKMEYEVTLNDALKALGMDIAFRDDADFTGINAAGGLSISRVLQKTFVEVNEEGTEAAAATAVEIIRTSAPPTFRVDRPYVFALRERTTGTILFIGRITQPAG
jgi:serine protease inhibitor